MKFQTMLSLVFMAMISAASAHETKGIHGGRVVDAGNYHVELVITARNLDVYVRDHNDKPVAAAGFKGLAIFAADGKSHRIVLESQSSEKLTGASPVDLSAMAKGVVQVTPPNGKTVNARFN